MSIKINQENVEINSRHLDGHPRGRTVRYRKLTAWTNIVTGVSMIVMWIMLIASNQVQDFPDHMVSYGFHWISELGTALALIISGLHILLRHLFSRRFYFLATGLVLNASLGAVAFYIVNYDAQLLGIMSVVTCIIVGLSLLNRGGFEDLSNMSIGVVLYGGINVTGNLLDRLDYSSLAYSGMVLLFGIMLLFERLRNRA
jgi:hypothetical protein